MAKKEPKEKYIYKSELELMQESYNNCYSKPSKKLVKEAFGDEYPEDDYSDDGMDDTYDSDMEGFEEERSEIDPSDMSEMCNDICAYIKDKLVEFGYSPDQFNEVVAGLGECEFESDSFGESDAAADYDEENPDLYSEEDEEDEYWRTKGKDKAIIGSGSPDEIVSNLLRKYSYNKGCVGTEGGIRHLINMGDTGKHIAVQLMDDYDETLVPGACVILSDTNAERNEQGLGINADRLWIAKDEAALRNAIKYDQDHPDLYSEDEENMDDGLEDSSDDMFEPGV